MIRGLALAALAALALCAGPLAGPAQAAESKTVSYNTTLRYANGSYVVGNAYRGWTDVVQGGTTGSYRWGYVDGGTFQRCTWIYAGAVPAGGSSTGDRCGAAQGRDNAYFVSTYTNGQITPPDGGTTTTHVDYGHTNCADHNGYGNVRPWLVPAEPHNSIGAIPDGTEVGWRYVTRDGHWVMVKVNGAPKADPAHPDVAPNWVFVARNCLTL